MFPCPGRYVIFGDEAKIAAISLAVSILLTSSRPCPCCAMLSEINRAASASPSARITAAFLSSSRCMTVNFARSASYCATCFYSQALVNSGPNFSSVIDTSSSIIWYSDARAIRPSLISYETASRIVSSCSALY